MTREQLPDWAAERTVPGGGLCPQRTVPLPHCGEAASGLVDGLAVLYTLGVCRGTLRLGEGPPPAPPSLFYLLEEVMEPGPEDVDISISRAVLHLPGDKREAVVVSFEGQETGHAEGKNKGALSAEAATSNLCRLGAHTD